MDQAEKRGADGKLPRSPSSVLQQLDLLQEAEALEELRLSDQRDEDAGRAEEQREEGPGSGKPNPAAAGTEGGPAASLPAPPRPVRRQQPAYAPRGSDYRGSPCSPGAYGQAEWHPPQQPVSPVYFVPQYEAYSPEAPLGSTGLVARPYGWHYGTPYQVYPGVELGPPLPNSPLSPAAGCVPPGAPCGPDYYCMGPPMPFVPGMPGMGGPAMVLGPNGPVPAGLVMPHYGGPAPYPPGNGVLPRFGAPQPLPSSARMARPHKAGDDIDKFRFNPVEAREGKPNARTTIMIKNVPNKYSQRMLLDTFDRRFRGKYDFFYLPIDYKNKCNLGYCFINFVNSQLTAECYEEFHQKRWEEFNSKKVAEVCYAKVQSCNGCIEHFKNAKFPCLDVDCLPLVFVPADVPGEPMHTVPVSPRQQAAA